MLASPLSQCCRWRHRLDTVQVLGANILLKFNTSQAGTSVSNPGRNIIPEMYLFLRVSRVYRNSTVDSKLVSSEQFWQQPPKATAQHISHCRTQTSDFAVFLSQKSDDFCQ